MNSIVKLLDNAVVEQNSALVLKSDADLDLNGKTMTVNGRITCENEVYLNISCQVSSGGSGMPGIFTTNGIIETGLCTWTADTINITGGELKGYLGVDGGTINISGGALNGGMMFNNGGDADVHVNISGKPCFSAITDYSFVIYAPAVVLGDGRPWHNIHMSLKGGYFAQDPRMLFQRLDSESGKYEEHYETAREFVPSFAFYKKTDVGYVKVAGESVTEEEWSNGSIYYCYNDFVDVDAASIETYQGQADWTADSSVYKWRIPSTDNGGSGSESGGGTGTGQKTDSSVIASKAAGTVFADNVSKAEYVVTSKAGTTAEVAYKADKSGGKTVTIPATVTIEGVTYQVTSIADNALANNAIAKTIKVGANVKKIGKNAFANCKSLTKLTIPANVESIGKQILKGTKKLKTLTIKSTKLTAKTVKSGAFKGINATAKVKVPKSKKKDYAKFFYKKGLPKKIKF